MTYFGFLIRFLFIPILILAGVHLLISREKRPLPDVLRGMPAFWTVAGHMLVALIYTTPWDNYLIATGVWYYNPDLVSGIVLGWVPIEEYTFFLVQPVLAGLWMLLMARLLKLGPESRDYARPQLRLWSVVAVGLFWLVWLALLISGWAPATYMALILVWALPPIMIQLAFGADILWHYRKLVFWSLVPSVLYLSAADFLAIGSGTWTIDPAQSFNIFIGRVLPIEEAVFFLMTSTLLVLGMTLVLAKESQRRLNEELLPWWNARRNRRVVEG